MPEKKPEKEINGKEKQKVNKVRFSYPWDIIIYPHLAEKSMKMVEMENKLVFIVRRNASKKEIKEAVEKAFNVKAEKVNLEITASGEKKAFVKLKSEFSASDIATRMGMV